MANGRVFLLKHKKAKVLYHQQDFRSLNISAEHVPRLIITCYKVTLS